MTEPATFQPYTLPLIASDGTVTGNITGIDFTTARLLAAGNVTLGNESFSLIISEDLSQKPDSPTMDIKWGTRGACQRA
ncbi:MAG: hypothetical protein ACM3NG_00125 [Candidatus Doudnabacteria bacterium]